MAAISINQKGISTVYLDMGIDWHFLKLVYFYLKITLSKTQFIINMDNKVNYCI